MAILAEIVKILSEDSKLMENKLKFLDSLGIPEKNVGPWVKLYDMGHCQPCDLMHGMLAEWISTGANSATVAELRMILYEIGFVQCSDKLKIIEEMHPGPIELPGLKSSLASDANTNSQVTFGVKDVVPNFVGRVEELQILETYYHSKDCRIVFVTGQEGVGKTELVKKFTHKISDPIGNLHIAKTWLNGETPQTLLNSIRNFCRNLQLIADTSKYQLMATPDMLYEAMNKIKSTAKYSRCLVVIDTADEIHQEFKTVLKTLSDLGSFFFIIVISTRCDIAPSAVHLNISALKPLDSVEFVKNSLETTETSSDGSIKELCIRLCNFPLALSLAVAYNKQQQIKPLIRKAYGKKNHFDELAKQVVVLDNYCRFGEYVEATFAVLNVALNQIETNLGAQGKMTLDILNVMAFITADNIQISCLQKLFKGFNQIQEVDMNLIHSCFTLLLQYSMISYCKMEFSIHRVVQLALRERMAVLPLNHTPRKDVEMLKYFWSSFNPQEWTRDEMANILKIWKHSCSHLELYGILATKIRPFSLQLVELGMGLESWDFTKDFQILMDLYHQNKEELTKKLSVEKPDSSLTQKLKSVYESFKFLLTGGPRIQALRREVFPYTRETDILINAFFEPSHLSLVKDPPPTYSEKLRREEETKVFTNLSWLPILQKIESIDNQQAHLLSYNMKEHQREIDLSNFLHFLAKDASLLPNITLFSEFLNLNISDEQWKIWCNQLAANDLTISGFIRNVLAIWHKQEGELATLNKLVSILGDFGCQNAAEKLRSEHSRAVLNVPINWLSHRFETPITFGVVDPVSSFIGREIELIKIAQLLADASIPGIILHGPVGVGKTQLVRKFIWRLQNSLDKPQFVGWLDGVNTIKFTESLKQLCMHLFIPVIDSETGEKLCHKDMLKSIMQELLHFESNSNKRPCLLVIDNVKELSGDVYQAIQNGIDLSVVFPVIICRQKNNSIDNYFALLPVTGLDIEDSKSFLIKELKLIDPNDKELTDLCIKLRNFPLWLQQVVVYIDIKRNISWQGSDYGVASYLKEYEKDNTTGLTERLPFDEYGEVVLPDNLSDIYK